MDAITLAIDPQLVADRIIKELAEDKALAQLRASRTRLQAQWESDVARHQANRQKACQARDAAILDRAKANREIRRQRLKMDGYLEMMNRKPRWMITADRKVKSRETQVELLARAKIVRETRRKLAKELKLT